ncbi:MAG: hypothetical protein EOL97_13770 [Spirochaetia bacterium]|nr:hypothetical protein [Spirochaetia bacterium]
MVLKFLLDDREHSEELKQAFKIVGIERMFDYETSHLEIGDVQCGNIVIERKEASDFVCSIMDGRLKEQARKMQLGFEYRYIIIEGSPYRTMSAISEVAIIGKMTSLLVKHKIGLLYVESPLQFVEACYSIIKRHQEENIFDPTFIPSAIPKKSDEDILAMMLMSIQGISYDKAKDISNLYGNSMNCLVNNCNVKQLMTISGIGKVVATRIVEFMKK